MGIMKDLLSCVMIFYIQWNDWELMVSITHNSITKWFMKTFEETRVVIKQENFYMSLLEDKLICELIQQVLLNCW